MTALYFLSVYSYVYYRGTSEKQVRVCACVYSSYKVHTHLLIRYRESPEDAGKALTLETHSFNVN